MTKLKVWLCILFFYLILVWGVRSIMNRYVTYSVHKSMVLDQRIPWDYVSFETFLKEFKKVNWIINPKYPSARFDKNGSDLNMFHADVIKLEGKGMVIEFWDIGKYIDFKNKLDGQVKKNIPSTPGLWDRD